jgi:hypothetical protein
MAKGISDLATREMCLEPSRRFRDIAHVKNVTRHSDIEVVQLAERMVGKIPTPDKDYEIPCQVTASTSSLQMGREAQAQAAFRPNSLVRN